MAHLHVASMCSEEQRERESERETQKQKEREREGLRKRKREREREREGERASLREAPKLMKLRKPKNTSRTPEIWDDTIGGWRGGPGARGPESYMQACNIHRVVINVFKN